MKLFTWEVARREERFNPFDWDRPSNLIMPVEQYPFPVLNEGIVLNRADVNLIGKMFGDYLFTASSELAARPSDAVGLPGKVRILRAEVEVDHELKLVNLAPERTQDFRSVILCDLRLDDTYTRLKSVGSGAERLALAKRNFYGFSQQEDIVLVAMGCNGRVTMERLQVQPPSANQFVHAVTLRETGGCYMSVAGDGNCMFD